MGKRIAPGGNRYGKDGDAVEALKSRATDLIKIGFNAAEGDGVKPGKLNNFLIFRNSLGNDNKYLINFDAMARLGHTPDQIAKAKAAGFKADPSLLPSTLHFIIMNDAVKVDGVWNYPFGIEQFQLFNEMGLFCRGDGCNAKRRQPDGSTRIIECKPYGSVAHDPPYCEYSGPDRPCKYRFGLVVCLYYWRKEDVDENGLPIPGRKPQLVNPALGYSARFFFSGTGEPNGKDLFENVLDPAAERVNGRLNGITGTMSFTKKGRRTGKSKDQGQSKAYVGYIYFDLDEASLRAREQEIAREQERNFSRQITAAKVGLQLQLPAPPSAHGDDFISDAQPVQVIPTAADPFDAPAERDGLDTDYDATDTTPDPREGLVSPAMGAARLAVEQASHAQLEEALDRYAHIQCDGDEERYRNILNLKVFNDASGKVSKGKVVMRIESVDWFHEGETPEKQQARTEKLKSICLDLAESQDEGFEILPEVE